MNRMCAFCKTAAATREVWTHRSKFEGIPACKWCVVKATKDALKAAKEYFRTHHFDGSPR